MLKPIVVRSFLTQAVKAQKAVIRRRENDVVLCSGIGKGN